MSVQDCIQEAVACAYEAKAAADVDICKVSMIQRTWTGSSAGRGDATDVETPVSPNPSIVEFKHNLAIKTGGNVKAGDILIKGIVRLNYAEESMVDGSSTAKNIENFYKICDKLYQVVSVRKRIGTWEVLVRRLSAQRTY